MLVRALLAVVFFGAGVSKLQTSGLDWAFSDNLAHLMLRHHYSHRPVVEWGLWLLQLPWLMRIAAVGSLALEVAAPLALLHRYLAIAIMGGLATMQLGIWLFLGVSFRTYVVLYLFFVPWDLVYAAIRTTPRSSRST